MIQLALFSLTLGIIECSSFHARIGNYSQTILGYNLCGIRSTKNSTKMHNKCFKHHQDLFVPLINARVALEGEAPWVVHIQTYIQGSWSLYNEILMNECTGSLIAPQWVLTAAHCFTNQTEEKVRVHFGTEYSKGLKMETKLIVAHHKYSRKSDYDIAMVQLVNPVQIEEKDQFYPINTLCLPPNHIIPAQNELTFISGWGIGHKNHLQMGSRLLLGKLTKLMGNELIVFEQQSLTSNGTMVCRHDSGSPVWQYFMGRAVQIGVVNGIYGGTGGCSDRSYGIHVPQVVDWIIATMGQFKN